MKASVVDNSLIQLVFLEWKHVKAGAQFTSITGDRIAIIDKGDTFDEQRLLCLNAKVEINDCEKQGHIAFGNRELNANQGVVLHVMDKEGLGILSDDFRLIPQIVVPVDPELEDLLKSLIKGSKSCDCVKKILEIDPFVVSHFMNSLLYERLENKYNEVMQKHEMGGCNWHQTLHLMLFRAMGSPANTQAFVEIAKRVPYNVASHEI